MVKASHPSKSKCKCASTAVETVCQSQDTVKTGPTFEHEIRDLKKLPTYDAEKEVFSAVSKNCHHHSVQEDVRTVTLSNHQQQETNINAKPIL